MPVVVGQHLGDAADAGGDGGRAAGQRLDQRQRHALAPRRHGEDVRAAQLGAQRLAPEMAGEAHPVAEARRGDPRLEVGAPLALARDHRLRLRQARHRLDRAGRSPCSAGAGRRRRSAPARVSAARGTRSRYRRRSGSCAAGPRARRSARAARASSPETTVTASARARNSGSRARIAGRRLEQVGAMPREHQPVAEDRPQREEVERGAGQEVQVDHPAAAPAPEAPTSRASEAPAPGSAASAGRPACPRPPRGRGGARRSPASRRVRRGRGRARAPAAPPPAGPSSAARRPGPTAGSPRAGARGGKRVRSSDSPCGPPIARPAGRCQRPQSLAVEAWLAVPDARGPPHQPSPRPRSGTAAAPMPPARPRRGMEAIMRRASRPIPFFDAPLPRPPRATCRTSGCGFAVIDPGTPAPAADGALDGAARAA